MESIAKKAQIPLFVNFTQLPNRLLFDHTITSSDLAYSCEEIAVHFVPGKVADLQPTRWLLFYNLVHAGSQAFSHYRVRTAGNLPRKLFTSSIGEWYVTIEPRSIRVLGAITLNQLSACSEHNSALVHIRLLISGLSSDLLGFADQVVVFLIGCCNLSP